MKKGAGMKMVIGLICVLILGAGAFLLIRGRKDPVPSPGELGDPSEDRTLLIEYVKRRTGTNGGDGYSSTVLYLNSDGTAEVHYYSCYQPDETVSHTAYRVDPSVIEEAYNIISDNRMSSWNDREYLSALDGGSYALTFRTADGEYIKVSSDNMPGDGVTVMGEVRHCLEESTDGAEKIELTE